MADHDEATTAIRALNGEILDGRRMQVALSKDDPSVSSETYGIETCFMPSDSPRI